MDIDLTDLRILRHLEKNAKTTNQELADAVNLSASACFRRVKLMEDAGVIAGYRCAISAKECGLEFEAIVHVSMRHDVDRWHENFVQALGRWPEVVEARIVTGSTNYVLTVRTRNLDHYSDFVQNQLHKAPGVMSTNSNIVLATLKRDGSLLDLIKLSS
ncbi:Leucine-responsive regulatory protein [Collimonas arenae]|uniref:Leucine-responsive regulatory protein n=1 Tax=Collimonas arenae TaxID=279058 RepID=A0A0A1FBP2_9BURK|nr:Lrp/AsnC family transcriptional regulator [Collimonas arenae]AIY41961.1 Leucine-responsive regulatory protein [Collimonas arenae]